jgi:hypothetical protein
MRDDKDRPAGIKLPCCNGRKCDKEQRLRRGRYPLRAQAKTKAAKKPQAAGGKIAHLLESAPSAVDEADDRGRPRSGGVQSLGRAFAILEAVARHRDGIGLSELSKLVGLHNSTTFHLAKTMVSLGYIRQDRDTRRYRVAGRCLRSPPVPSTKSR